VACKWPTIVWPECGCHCVTYVNLAFGATCPVGAHKASDGFQKALWRPFRDSQPGWTPQGPRWPPEGSVNAFSSLSVRLRPTGPQMASRRLCGGLFGPLGPVASTDPQMVSRRLTGGLFGPPGWFGLTGTATHHLFTNRHARGDHD